MPLGDASPVPRISVCMATYNGARFVRDQVTSILDELGPADELVVADDASTDDTLQVLREVRDARIVILRMETNSGHVRTFERAMQAARGDVVMLADQDDLWPEGRVAALTAALELHPVVAGNLEVLGGGPAPSAPRLRHEDSGRALRNIMGVLTGRRAYFGSAMAYRSGLAPTLLPFPGVVEAHDIWLALAGSRAGGVGHVETPVVLRRVHGENLTPEHRRRLDKVAITRLQMVAQLAVLVVRRTRVGWRT